MVVSTARNSICKFMKKEPVIPAQEICLSVDFIRDDFARLRKLQISMRAFFVPSPPET